jgi:hypothetical protein
MFSDRFVKVVLDFEIKLFCHCLVAFGFQRSVVDHTPIAFQITQRTYNEKDMGF